MQGRKIGYKGLRVVGLCTREDRETDPSRGWKSYKTPL